MTKDVYSVGVLNPNLRVFDIVMATDYGTSYNSYIIKDEKTALVETCHARYFDEYIENIRQVVNPEEIDYIIMNHTEPDHSGALEMLLSLCPKAEIVCSRAASIYLKKISNREFPVHVATDGEALSLGEKELTFISAPLLHWPDSMFTYLASEKLLFTCDFLGAHYCEPRMKDTCITHPKAYQKAFLGYYQAIFSPFSKYVQAGLKKMRALDVELVCPSHGPTLCKNGLLNQAMADYDQWSAPVKKERLTVPVFYCSAYGYTEELAEEARRVLKQVHPQAEVELYNIIEHPMDSLALKLNSADAFLIGTPTINRDAVPPVWQLLSHVDAVNNVKKPVAVFGSYGWTGEGVPAVCQRLATLKFKVQGDGYRAVFKPNEQELRDFSAFVEEFAQSLK